MESINDNDEKYRHCKKNVRDELLHIIKSD